METLVATNGPLPFTSPAGAGTTPPQPTVEISMAKKNVSAELGPYLEHVSYTDNLAGEADTVELTLDNSSGIWLDAWYPDLGDTLSVSIGYAGLPLLVCGEFEIDEVGASGLGSLFTIKGLSAGVSTSSRTKKARAYEKTTLKAVAERVAHRHKLTVVGNIEPISIERITQIHETDLAFLRRLAEQYGYSFNVRGQQLVFYRMDDLRKSKPAFEISRLRSEITSYDLKDKIKNVPASAEVKYRHARQRKTIRHKEKNTKGGGDELKINARVESAAQAKTQAKAALASANDDKTTGTLVLPGNTILVAGVTLVLVDFGKLDGQYLINKSTHDFGRDSGYGTSLEIKRT